MLRTFFTTVAAGSLFVGGLAATHVAFAQPGPDGGPRPRGGIMALADANKDGNISKAELTAALDARFARLDVDHDGQITRKDRDARRQQRLDERFAAMDTDRNGQISKAEFTAAQQARAAKWAEKRADAAGPEGRRWGKGPAGGPGRGMMGRPGALRNAGPDAVVTKAQFMARPLAMFDRADANRDGVVTADEMKAARQAMRGRMGPGRDAPPPPPQD
jgi:Ca2+-binding EF-hand superfamily protein